jgi:YspA, cpYpsA-related SLOG family
VIIGVAASRTWTSRAIISAAYDSIFDPDDTGPMVVIEGGAQGGDALCRTEAESRGWHVATVRALWGFHGKPAGLIRNNAMICLGANASYWLVFVNPCAKGDCRIPKPHDSHGARQCGAAARLAGITVREYRDG